MHARWLSPLLLLLVAASMAAQRPRPEPLAVEIAVGRASGPTHDGDVLLLGVVLPPAAGVFPDTPLRVLGARRARCTPKSLRPDGSIAVLRIAAEVAAGTSRLVLARGTPASVDEVGPVVRLAEEDGRVLVDTGALRVAIGDPLGEGVLLERLGADAPARLLAGLRDRGLRPLELGDLEILQEDALSATIALCDRAAGLWMALRFRAGQSRIDVEAQPFGASAPGAAPELLLRLDEPEVQLARDDALDEGWVGYRERFDGGVRLAGGVGFSARRGGPRGLVGDLIGVAQVRRPHLHAVLDWTPKPRGPHDSFLDPVVATVLAGGDPVWHSEVADRPVADLLAEGLRTTRAHLRALARGEDLSELALRRSLLLDDEPLRVRLLREGRPEATIAEQREACLTALWLGQPWAELPPLDASFAHALLSVAPYGSPTALVALGHLGAEAVTEHTGFGRYLPLARDAEGGFETVPGAVCHLLVPITPGGVAEGGLAAPQEAGLRQVVAKARDAQLLAAIPPGRLADPRADSVVWQGLALAEASAPSRDDRVRRRSPMPLYLAGLVIAVAVALGVAQRRRRRAAP